MPVDTRTEPTKAPRTAADCWPFPCASYHETWAHLEGEWPCECPCHRKAEPTELELRAIYGDR